MAMATVKIENGVLKVEMPMQTPTPSASGKTLIVASTHGPEKTVLMVNGKQVTINVNAYISAH